MGLFGFGKRRAPSTEEIGKQIGQVVIDECSAQGLETIRRLFSLPKPTESCFASEVLYVYQFVVHRSIELVFQDHVEYRDKLGKAFTTTTVNACKSGSLGFSASREIMSQRFKAYREMMISISPQDDPDQVLRPISMMFFVTNGVAPSVDWYYANSLSLDAMETWFANLLTKHHEAFVVLKRGLGLR